jgi:RecG-like helicase
MSSFEPGFGCSKGWPVAGRIADAHERERIVVSGRVLSTRCVRHGSGPAYRCELDDGSGTLGLLFLGRTGVPGFVVGGRCTVAGTVQRDAQGLVIWNPWYQLEACDSQWPRGDNMGGRPWRRRDDGRHNPTRG